MYDSLKKFNYGELCTEVYDKIGKEVFAEVSSQDEWFEIEYLPINPNQSFMGFLEVYALVREKISEKAIILDFGCSWAPQSYMFDGYREYIGIEPCKKPEQRFSTNNTKHFQMTAQEFISKDTFNVKDVFAICSYVPDEEAMNMIREKYPNHFVVYPECYIGVYDFSVKNIELCR